MLDEERLEFVRAIRDSAGAIAPRGGALDRVRAQRFKSPGFELGVWKQMAEMGWTACACRRTRAASAWVCGRVWRCRKSLGVG